jgi:DNA invertase Pin-like site-specific DNA recombinase/regulator of replication initiation timing
VETQVRKIVTKIDANPLLIKHNNENALLRVAAYCRVSTDSDDQIESYKAQVAHYSEVIAKNPRWRFVDIYADEGITGTMAKKRPNFLRMIRDCDKGKIDLILTKSVARFARNTVDSLNYVRRLKAKGIGVFFEEQNLDSLKADSEMLIGFHSVMAQAESENISANVRWGIRQRMRTGTFAFRYNILGYRKGADGQPEIVPEEAEYIQTIYRMYLDGNSLDQIKKYLERNRILTAQGKTEWSLQIIRNILTNERYSGDMLLQKTFTENPISKKVKKNRGEMAKYLITNNHPAIIDKDTFKLVQREVARRGSKRKTADKSITEQGKYSGKFALTELLVCGECGSPYRRMTWTKKGKSRKVWRCLSRVEHGTQYCFHSISVEETKLQNAICRALNKAVEHRQEVLDLIMSNLSYGVTGDDDVLYLSSLEKQIKDLDEEMDRTVRLSYESNGDPKRFREMISELCCQMSALRQELELTKSRLEANEKVSVEIERIKSILSDETMRFNEYDEVTVRRLVEYIRVMADNRIIVVLKGGMSIEESINEKSE